MNSQVVINTLEEYEKSLKEILSRFQRTRDSVLISLGDEDLYKRIVLEAQDLLNDALGKNRHSQLIGVHFDESISNFLQSPSFQGVSDVLTVISAAKARIMRNPELVKDSPNQVAQMPETTLPEKITLGWLVAHVPVSFWVAAATLIAATFVAGVRASQYSVIKEIFLP